MKENIKAPRHWPLWGEFSGDQWIPRTKGQLRRKCFHLMTSSWWYRYIPFQMMLCQSTTILAYLCLVQLDKVYCLNISLIPRPSPSIFSYGNMGIRHITSELIRTYVNITVSKIIEYMKQKRNNWIFTYMMGFSKRNNSTNHTKIWRPSMDIMISVLVRECVILSRFLLSITVPNLISKG